MKERLRAAQRRLRERESTRAAAEPTDIKGEDGYVLIDMDEFEEVLQLTVGSLIAMNPYWTYNVTLSSGLAKGPRGAEGVTCSFEA